MGLVQKNIIANFMGKVWVTIVTYLSIPFYIKLLGIESYGLIGFNVTLNAMISLLDLGFSVTLNKELAKLSAISGTEQKSRDLVRTLEIVYWPIAIFIGIVVISLSSLIASQWVHAEHIPSATIQKAVIMMGISIAIQWPFTLYQSAMLGLQRQKEMSIISSFISSLPYSKLNLSIQRIVFCPMT